MTPAPAPAPGWCPWRRWRRSSSARSGRRESCGGAKVGRSSGDPLVYVVKPAEHPPDPDGPRGRAAPWPGRLQTERAMWAIYVVVAREFGEHRPEMLLVQ